MSLRKKRRLRAKNSGRSTSSNGDRGEKSDFHRRAGGAEGSKHRGGGRFETEKIVETKGCSRLGGHIKKMLGSKEVGEATNLGAGRE